MTKQQTSTTPSNSAGQRASSGAAAPAFRAAAPLTIPVMTGYLFLGMTYGILMVTSGFPIFYPILTAVIVYTGSMEFLLVSILLSPFHPLACFMTALMVGARHLFYGISMLDRYKGTGWKKFYLIYTTSDETFAVNYSAQIPDGIDRGWFYFAVSLLDQLYWVAGTALGAFFGSRITFNTRGLDFVMTAMFVTIFMNQWLKDKKRGHLSEIIGVLGSLLCLLIFGPDRFIIPAMAVILAALTLLRPVLEKKESVTDVTSLSATSRPSVQEVSVEDVNDRHPQDRIRR